MAGVHQLMLARSDYADDYYEGHGAATCRRIAKSK